MLTDSIAHSINPHSESMHPGRTINAGQSQIRDGNNQGLDTTIDSGDTSVQQYGHIKKYNRLSASSRYPVQWRQETYTAFPAFTYAPVPYASYLAVLTT